MSDWMSFRKSMIGSYAVQWCDANQRNPMTRWEAFGPGRPIPKDGLGTAQRECGLHRTASGTVRSRERAAAGRSRNPVPEVTRQLASLKAALAERYRVERELGHGGMATVWLAHDLKHDRPVALKVLRPELAAVLGPERFLREVLIAAHLTHPHIIPLYDSGEVDGFMYYVMPYVEGESLRNRLTHEQQLPVEQAVQIARDVADALSYAHAHDVIHRDIK